MSHRVWMTTSLVLLASCDMHFASSFHLKTDLLMASHGLAFQGTHSFSHRQHSPHPSALGTSTCVQGSSQGLRCCNVRKRTLNRVSMNLFDGFAAKLKEQVADMTMQVRVQHILVDTEAQAVELRKRIAKEGLDTFGQCAKEFSTCGSAKKTPQAKMAQLRGLPGEMVFRKGQTDKAFERAAFEGPVGTLQGPVKTKFGYHLILVNDRSEGLGGDENGDAEVNDSQSAVADDSARAENKPLSKSASKKKLKAQKKRSK